MVSLIDCGIIDAKRLTFSRGGVFNFTIGLAAALLYLMRKPDKYVKILFDSSVKSQFLPHKTMRKNRF